jgi:imidazolonepropionase-like amidohydrolase
VLQTPPAMLAMLAARGLTPELVMQAAAQQAARLLGSGVRLVAGTDSGVGEGKPHGMLALSLSALVDAGVAPTAALASATSVAAEALGVGDAKGRIAAGFDADLVLVDGDPGSDIAALQHVRQVYVGGELAYSG